MSQEKRWARRDLSSVSDADAARLLKEYRELIYVEIGYAPSADRDDLEAIAQIAVVEAHATWDESQGMNPRSWTRQLIRWRLREYRQHMIAQKAHLTYGDSDSVVDPQEDAWSALPPNPEQILDKKLRRAAVHSQLPFLDIRNQVIIDAELRGETGAAAARTLGMTKQRASVLRKQALLDLQVFLSDSVDPAT